MHSARQKYEVNRIGREEGKDVYHSEGYGVRRELQGVPPSLSPKNWTSCFMA